MLPLDIQVELFDTLTVPTLVWLWAMVSYDDKPKKL